MRTGTRELRFIKLREERIGLLLRKQISRTDTCVTRHSRCDVVDPLLKSLPPSS
jgi:hypothetical protein